MQRIEPISIWGTPENALDSYLQSGPLRQSGRWTITTPITTTTLEDRDARMVELEGSDSEGGAAAYAHRRRSPTTPLSTSLSRPSPLTIRICTRLPCKPC
ncbi:MAG: hypothetical protein U0694_13365 [Anaerolineae bacterium]